MPISYPSLTVAAGAQVQLSNHHQYVKVAGGTDANNPTKIFLPQKPVPFAPVIFEATTALSASSFVEIVQQSVYTIDFCGIIRMMEGYDFLELMPDASGNWRVLRGTNVGLIQIEQVTPTSVASGAPVLLQIDTEYKDSMERWNAAGYNFIPRGDFSWDVGISVVSADPGAGKFVEVGLSYTSAPSAFQISRRFYGGHDIYDRIDGKVRVAGLTNDSTLMGFYAVTDAAAPINVYASAKLRRSMN